MKKIFEITDENRGIKDDILNFMVGDLIGEGCFRRVYEMGVPDQVLKIEHCGREFCNMVEWKVWQAVEHTPLAEWFAPCIDIDMMGVALIQKRTKPIDSEEEFKKLVETTRQGCLPSFLDDIHFKNFGLLDGLVVCHDYAFNHFLEEAVKMEWQDVVHPDVKIATPKRSGQLALPL